MKNEKEFSGLLTGFDDYVSTYMHVFGFLVRLSVVIFAGY